MNKLGFYHYYAFLWLSHRQFLMPRYSSWASYNSQPMVKRMLSLFMCKTFLSILAVPNMTDFCTIPTFNLMPSESTHPLRPLLMHPRAPTTTSTTSTFFNNQSLFSSHFKFWYFSIFSNSFTRILQPPGIATWMMTHDFTFLSTKIKLGLLTSIKLSH